MARYINLSKDVGVIQFCDGSAKYLRRGESTTDDRETTKVSNGIRIQEETVVIEGASEEATKSEETTEVKEVQPKPKKRGRKKKNKPAEQLSEEKIED